MTRVVLIALAVGLPLGWLLSEFSSKRALRIVLGILALLSSFAVAGLVGMMCEFNYNAWYGSATRELLTTTIAQVEDGNLQRVLTVLRGLNAQFRPTYEHRAQYRELVDDATARMRGEVAIDKGSAWDTSPFDQTAWNGCWQSDSGFRVVIEADADALRVLRPTRIDVMKSISISDDSRTLEFKEGEDFVHTLVLRNKYEATHESLDLSTHAVWEADTLHRLTRATPQQKQVTQQPDPTGKP